MNTEQNIMQISIDLIYPNRFQPRLNFEDKGIEELSNSIKEHGIIQPLVLRKIGDKYEIVAGERRYKAAIEAGLTTVPAIISDVDDQKSAEVAIVENIQRRNLSPIEEARSYKNLLDKGYITQSQLARKMGLSQSAIANKLRLLNLDESVQRALLDNLISERHARSLLVLHDAEDQKAWLKRIINERLTVRQLDEKLKNYISEIEKDIQYMQSINMQNIKQQAKDLPKLKQNDDIERKLKEIENEKIFNSDIVYIDQAKNESGTSFFNFLEDEKVNMNMEELSIEKDIIEKLEGVKEVDNKEDIMFENNIDNKDFDPVDLIETLDPTYQEKVEQFLGTDLKTAITNYRNLSDSLKEKGFKLLIEETDLNDSYQILIKIQK